jgi:hypothetical protein
LKRIGRDRKEKEKSMRKVVLLSLLIMVVIGLIVTGCSNMKGKAETALTVAEKAISDAKPEAEKIVPDQIKALEEFLSGAKEKFNTGDYAAALSDAQTIPGKVTEMVASLAAKKEELTGSWTGLEQGIPAMMDAIKSKLDVLSKSKKLPANLTKEKLEEAKSGFDSAVTEWEAVAASYNEGSLAKAVTEGNTLKEKIVQVLQILELPIPQAAQ